MESNDTGKTGSYLKKKKGGGGKMPPELFYVIFQKVIIPK